MSHAVILPATNIESHQQAISQPAPADIHDSNSPELMRSIFQDAKGASDAVKAIDEPNTDQYHTITHLKRANTETEDSDRVHKIIKATHMESDTRSKTAASEQGREASENTEDDPSEADVFLNALKSDISFCLPGPESGTGTEKMGRARKIIKTRHIESDSGVMTAASEQEREASERKEDEPSGADVFPNTLKSEIPFCLPGPEFGPGMDEFECNFF